MHLLKKTKAAVLATACLAFAAINIQAASFNVQTFATGSAVGATAPDSVEWGDGSLWIAYTNGADSTGASGSSTVVRYSPSGTVINTWSIKGNVDGLRVDPASGLVWAMQNNDANAALTVINPTTNATTAYTYGSSYNNPSARGFDDTVFRNGQIFMSETNPVNGSDPVVLRLTSGLTSPLQVSGILNSTFTGVNIATGKTGSTTITDSDSLILTPSGDLALTGEADKQIAFIHNPGASNQTASFLNLINADGSSISGKPDDTIFPTAKQGVIYVADTGANIVYKVTASGLAAGSMYVDAGTVFGSVDPATGILTTIFTGVSPHGGQFVATSATPEPASFAYLLGGLLVCGFFSRLRKGVRASAR